MIGQHMGLSEDVENMVSKKVIRDVRFKNMPVIHWGSKFWEFPVWGLQSSKQNRVQMNGVLMSKCRRPMRLFLVPINLAATMMAPQQQYTVISGCRSLSYQRRLHFLFGWSTACHNVCSGRLFPICIWRAQFSLSELPQEIPNFHSMFQSSLTPSWSCSPWTKTWRWIMPYIWSNPVFQHSKISILSWDSNTSMFQHIPTYSNTPRNKRSLNPPIPDDPRCFFAQKSWHPTGGRAPGHASIARCWTPASQPAARRNSGGWRCTCCGSSWVFPDGKRRINHENYHLVIYIT